MSNKPISCPIDALALLRLYDLAGTIDGLREQIESMVEDGRFSRDIVRRWVIEAGQGKCRVCGRPTNGRIDCSKVCQNRWYHSHLKKKVKVEPQNVENEYVTFTYFQNFVIDEKSADRFVDDIASGRLVYHKTVKM